MKTTLQKSLPLIALCLGFFMVIMDVTIVNVALPDMSKNLQGNISWLQWVVDGYTLTFACLLLSSGSFADRVGAKSTYLAGLVLFTLTSFGCGVSPNFLILIVMRLLQGMGAALLVPTSLSLVNASYEHKKDRAFALGMWSAIGGIAASAGPMLGGFLVSYFGWRSVFFVNIPIGLLVFFLTQKTVSNPKPDQTGHFDIAGQLLGIISIAALSFALIESGRFGFSSFIVITAFMIFAVTFIAFLYVEHNSTSPMIPLHFFKSSAFSTSIMIGWILSFGGYGLLFVLTLYFQHIRNYSPLVTGFAFFPFLGTNFIGSYLGGKLASISGSRLPMMIGLFVGAIGYFSLLFFHTETPYFMMILPLIAMGFGVAFVIPGATVTAIHSAPEGRAGIASGALNASRQLGSLMGVAIFGTIITLSKQFIVGMHIALCIGGFCYLGGCILVYCFISTDTDNAH